MAHPSLIAPTVAEAERIEAGGAIVPNEVAALLRHNADLVADFHQALAEERGYSARLSANCIEMANRLNRLGDHLRTLADYADAVGHDELDAPVPDPFPEAL